MEPISPMLTLQKAFEKLLLEPVSDWPVIYRLEVIILEVLLVPVCMNVLNTMLCLMRAGWLEGAPRPGSPTLPAF